MSKELEALNELKYKGFYYSKDGIDISTFVQMRLDIIESALKRLALFDDENVVAYLSRSDEKKLKALEIIKRNPLMICAEYYKCIVELKLTYQEYLKYFPNEEDRSIKTQEEYNLLKEVLKDE